MRGSENLGLAEIGREGELKEPPDPEWETLGG